MTVRKIDNAVDFDIEFPRTCDWLKEAHTYGENAVSFYDIIIGLAERDYQLWTTEHAACITSITEWEGKRVCVLFLIGGEKGRAMSEILIEGQQAVEVYAREHKCRGLLGIGRGLWARVLPAYGFQIIKTGVNDNTYYKELV